MGCDPNFQVLGTLILPIFLSLTSCATGAIPRKDGIDRFDRPYRLLTLDNGISVILLQDVNATIVASELNVAAGSMNDLPDMQGMAHFLEHLLFLGNKKFPEGEAFWKFTKENGGSLNAWTADDTTGYYFSITPDNLEQGLEHLGGLVFYPLFNETNVEKEISAVDSEYERGIVSSYWRKNRVLKVTSVPDHPYTLFTVGSRKMLITEPRLKGLNVTLELHNFHQKYYKPSQMSLAVIGKQSLDELEQFVKNSFGSVTDNEGNSGTFSTWENAWGPEQLGTVTEIVGREGTQDELSLYFPVPKDLEKPFDEYYDPLLSYKCSNCLYGYLDKKGWATSLYAGTSSAYRDFYLAYISITLTPKGFENVDDVVKTVYQYFELVKTTGPQKWFWDEYHTLVYIRDISTTKTLPQNQVGALANALVATNDTTDLMELLHREPKEVEFPMEKLLEVVSLLKPSNMRMVVSSTKFANNTKEYEELFKVPYNFRKIEDPLLQMISGAELNPDLEFPKPLQGLPKDFEVLDSTKPITEQPQLIYVSNYTELWHKFDTKFKVPTTVVYGSIFSPYKSTSLWDDMMGTLHDLAIDRCRSNWPSYLTYTDALLGNYGSNGWDDGIIHISMSGLSTTLPHTLNKLMRILSNCTLDQDGFKLILEKERNYLLSSVKSGPCAVARENMVLRETYWSADEKLEILNGITIEDLNTFQSKLFSQIRMKWFVYGNTLAPEATSMIKDAENHLISAYNSKPLPKKLVKVHARDIQIPSGTSWRLNLKSRATESNSTCTAVILQPDTHTLRDAVVLTMLNSLMSVPIFYELRTNQGLGYVVSATARGATDSSSLFGVVVQGAYKPSLVQEKIDTFLANFKEATLMKLNDTQFSTLVSSQKMKWEQSRSTLRGEASMLWIEVYNDEPHLIRRQSKVLDSLTLKDVIDYYEVLTNKCSRRSVAFHVTRDTEVPNSPDSDIEVTTPTTSDVDSNTVSTGDEETWMDSDTQGNGNSRKSCAEVLELEESKLDEWKQERYLLPNHE